MLIPPCEIVARRVPWSWTRGAWRGRLYHDEQICFDFFLSPMVVLSVPAEFSVGPVVLLPVSGESHNCLGCILRLLHPPQRE